MAESAAKLRQSARVRQFERAQVCTTALSIFTAASTALQALPHCRTAALLHCLAPAEAIPCGVRARTTVDLPHRPACRNARSQEICVCVSRDRTFFAPFLTPGQYGVKIELQGFRPLDRQAHAQGRHRVRAHRYHRASLLSPFCHRSFTSMLQPRAGLGSYPKARRGM